MILFLYGEDTYRSRRKLKEIKSSFTEKHGKENLTDFEFDRDQSSLYDLESFLKEQSMFASSQMAVTYDLLANIKLFNNKKKVLLEKIINDYTSDKYFWLVLWENKINRSSCKPYFDQIEKASKIKIKEFSKNKTGNLYNEGLKYLKKFGYSIDNKDLKEFSNKFGTDTPAFLNTLDSLIAFKGTDTQIRSNDLNFTNISKKDNNIFDILDAVNARNRPKLYLLLKKRFYLYKDDPLQLFGLVVSQLRKIILYLDLKNKNLDDNQISKKLKMKPYAISKMIGVVNKYTLVEIKKSFGEISKIDKDAKVGKISFEEMMDLVSLAI